MNEQAAQALYAAEAAGVRQIQGSFTDYAGGLCALGVLGYTPLQECLHLDQQYEFRELAEFECCGKTLSETGYIVHLNDDHDATFSQIARKLGPDSA